MWANITHILRYIVSISKRSTLSIAGGIAEGFPGPPESADESDVNIHYVRTYVHIDLRDVKVLNLLR